MTYEKLMFLVTDAYVHCKSLVEDMKKKPGDKEEIAKLFYIQNCLYLASVGTGVLVGGCGCRGRDASPCNREEQAVSHTVCDFSFPLFGGDHREKTKGDTVGVGKKVKESTHITPKRKGVGHNRKTIKET